MNILKHYKILIGISLAIILIGLGFFVTKGFNQGIDFKGGTNIQYYLKKDFDTKEVKDALKDISIDSKKFNAEYIKTGKGDTVDQEIIIRTAQSLKTADRKVIETALLKAFPEAVHRGTNQYSASVGSETKTRAFYSVIIAAVGMLIYITVRFEIIYGLASITALIHDVLILLAVYLIFRVPVNSPFIAAVLTVVGYSINDTIVVFDRIRENVKFERRPNYFEVANKSLNQTIVRSINTSFTTLLVIGSLYALGVDSIKELAFPLLAGVIAGTYSSIFIASPIWAIWKTQSAEKNKHYKGA